MNFASMDYFIMVAREKSFTKAAQRLYITQQTLSAHIASIEKELGCSLFVRHVPLELTYAGQVFLMPWIFKSAIAAWNRNSTTLPTASRAACALALPTPAAMP